MPRTASLVLFLFIASIGYDVLGQGRGNAVQRDSVEDRSSRSTARRKGDITFDDIKFDLEKGENFQRKMLTKEIEDLHKRDISIRGYMFPTFKQAGIEQFVLVRDNMECCFGPGAALYDCIMVHMTKGKTAEYSTRPITVKGRFEVEELKYPDSDECLAIYKLTATDVR